MSNLISPNYRFILRSKHEGQEVLRLQHRLGIKTTGKYDSNTTKAVKAYQKDNGLDVDGLAGPQTLGALGIRVLFGIDVSGHQGAISYKKVVDHSPTEYAIVKISEHESHVQKTGRANVQGFMQAFHDAGKPVRVGCYHFSQPYNDKDDAITDARQEADNFCRAWERLLVKPTMLPVNDVEKGLTPDDNHNADHVIAWGEHVLNRLFGITDPYAENRPLLVLYTARWAWNAYLRKADPEKLAKIRKLYLSWWADYQSYKNMGTEPEDNYKLFQPEWHMWQWENSCHIYGIQKANGDYRNVDGNWCNEATIGSLMLPKCYT